ncbi:MAG: alginate export family protein [Pseudomonadales bacterium]
MRANGRSLTFRVALAATLVCTVWAADVFAEDAAVTPPGLPAQGDWKLNLGATLGAFGFANSLYTDPKPGEPSGDLGDNWLETSVNIGLEGAYPMANASRFYGAVSAVGERTSPASPSLVGGDASSFEVEDLNIGWRSGTMLGQLGEDALDFTVGRARYQLGHGLLLWDGSSEGGSRGGYWTNARQAFEVAAIGRFRPGRHTLEAFYLERDELPEADLDSKVAGINYELALTDDLLLGATYMSWSADPIEAPQRDGLDVYNLRLFGTPLPGVEPLTVELEYSLEANGEALDASAWNALVGWRFGDGPTLSYRYAFFEGDDPDTSGNESFDPLLTGFYDWGAWWQGEIAGEYFVSNSNLISHQLRLHMDPSESVATGVILYDFRLHRPEALGATVTSDDVAFEIDWYLDWSINDHFTFSVVAAYANPGKAVEQSSGRTEDFYYGMVLLSYSL